LAKSKIGVGIDVVEYCDITIVLIQIILCDDKIFRYYIMEFFHLAVLTIATIIYIISLTTIGVIMKKGSRSGTFPPVASDCPDEWTTTSSPSGSNIIFTCSAPTNYRGATPSSSDNLAVTGSGSTLKFVYTDNTTSICDKKKWTTRNNIVWDGVSNYNSC
jgi:hypothetical protein